MARSIVNPAALASSLAILLGAVPHVQACSIILRPLNILDKKAEAPATVHGILIEKSIDTACERNVRQLRFRVSHAYGITAGIGDTVVINTPATSAACGVDYELGAEVVVFAMTNLSSCDSPGDFLFTNLGRANLVWPSQAQVDSLQGVVSLGGLASGPSSTSRLRPALSHGRVAFSPGPTRDIGLCGADGRALGPVGPDHP